MIMMTPLHTPVRPSARDKRSSHSHFEYSHITMKSVILVVALLAAIAAAKLGDGPMPDTYDIITGYGYVR
jgi:hypothetical protein